MSFRPGRTHALDPLTARQLEEGSNSISSQQKDSLLSTALSKLSSFPSPVPVSSPNVPASPVPSTPAPSTPSNFGLMTERQQLAYLMRATSEGEAVPSAKRSILAARKKDQEEEDEEEEEESEESEVEEDDDDEEEMEPAVPTAPAPSSSVKSKASDKDADLHPRSIRRPVEYDLWSPEKQKRWDGIYSNPNLFYLHHVGPGIVQKTCEWSEKERNHFLFTLEAHPPDNNSWGLFSMHIPGRTGLQCEVFAKKLVKEGVLVQSGQTKKNPIGTMKLAAKEAKKYKFESTPILVARPGVTSTMAKTISSSSATSSDAILLHELQTAIAILNLAPFPGTEGRKPHVVFQARMDKSQTKVLVKEQLEKRRKEKEKEMKEQQMQIQEEVQQKEKERASAPSVPSAKKTRETVAPISTTSSTPSSTRLPRAAAMTPSTPQPSHIASKKPGSGSSTGSGSSQLKKAQAVLEADMMDLSAEIASSRSASHAAAASSSAASRKRDSTTAEIDEPVVIPPPPTTFPSTMEEIHAVSRATVSTSAVPTILPFASFSIPSHTPYSNQNAKRRKGSSPVRVVRLDQQPTPIQARPFPQARFKREEEEDMQVELDPSSNQVVVRDANTDKVMHRGGDNGRSATSKPAASSSALSTASVDSMDVDSGFSSYSVELSKLESSFRLKLRRLASHQSTQLARIRPGYGVPAADEDGEEEDEGKWYGNMRVGPTPVPAPFQQVRNSFANGCKKMLQEYFNKENEAQAILSILNRCRTYGDAVVEIRSNYKSLLKELQREHATGRDVLNSLRTAGLLL